MFKAIRSRTHQVPKKKSLSRPRATSNWYIAFKKYYIHTSYRHEKIDTSQSCHRLAGVSLGSKNSQPASTLESPESSCAFDPEYLFGASNPQHNPKCTRLTSRRPCRRLYQLPNHCPCQTQYRLPLEQILPSKSGGSSSLTECGSSAKMLSNNVNASRWAA